MMYLSEPLIECTLSWYTFLAFVTSNGFSKTEKYHVSVIFLQFFANSTSPMEYTVLQDLKKVYCMGGSLEARWPSNGGHELSLNKPLHDVPF